LGPQEWANIYWEDWLKKISGDPDIRWRHEQELIKIIEGATSEKIPLFVVIFPNLAAVDESRPIIQPVINLCQCPGAPTSLPFDASGRCHRFPMKPQGRQKKNGPMNVCSSGRWDNVAVVLQRRDDQIAHCGGADFGFTAPR
jgi:hypothetical protein